MKPLMSQIQSQAALDDLLGSSKVNAGNFDLPRPKTPSIDKSKPNEPSFNEMLLAAIQKDSKPKQALAKAVAPKVPEPTPRIETPQTKAPKAPEIPKETPVKTSNHRALESSKVQDQKNYVDHAQNEIANASDATNNVVSETVKNTKAEDTITATTKDTGTRQSADDAKAALAPLKREMANKNSAEALLNGNAILAFISGRLDKLDPESLPSLITDSLLIKQAMSANDIAEFMQTPMSISELAKLLELDQGLLNKAVMNGLDSSKIVMPKDFIDALGLDANRVTAELKMLSQKLPSEGVKSYITRAKALADKNITGAVDLQPDDKGIKGLPQRGLSNRESAQDSAPSLRGTITNPGDISVPADLSNLSQHGTNNNALPIMGNGNVVNSMPSVKIPNAMDATPRAQQRIGGDLTSTNGQEISLSESILADSINGAMGIQNLAQNSLIRDNTRIGQNIAATSGVNSEFLMDLSAAEWGVDDTVEASAFSNDTALFDDIKRNLDASSNIKINFGGDGISQRSLEEHLLDNGLSFKQGSQELSNQSEGQLFELRENFAELQPNVINSDNDARQSLSLNNERQLLNQINTTIGETFSERSFANQDFAGSSSDQSGFGEQDLSEISFDLSANGTKAGLELKNESDIFMDKLADKSTAPTKSNLAQKILGQAQMMLNNGGGTMRVGMEAPGIGKIDVAIHLINNQLDVRIVTGSEQARDIIAKEVSGLREGLMQQGISLRGLEVGKAGESTPRNFAGQGQQHFGSGAQDQRATYNDMKEYVQSFKNSYNPSNRANVAPVLPTNRWGSSVGNITNGGRLEIRA